MRVYDSQIQGVIATCMAMKSAKELAISMVSPAPGKAVKRLEWITASWSSQLLTTVRVDLSMAVTVLGLARDRCRAEKRRPKVLKRSRG